MAEEETPFPGGPPAPIALLRRLSSEVDALIVEGGEAENTAFNANGKRRLQDPPARERPAVSESADDINLLSTLPLTVSLAHSQLLTGVSLPYYPSGLRLTGIQ